MIAASQQRVVVFTDIVDSTKVAERLGEARALELVAEHDRRTRALIAQHNGREIERTDGFIILFERMRDAAGFAMQYHDALVPLAVSARVGAHVGRVIVRENTSADIARGAKPAEVDGFANAVTARVMGLARGGQTLMTSDARRALGEEHPMDTAVRAHGHYRLKGIEAPVEIFELGRESAAFMPPADAEKAYRVVQRDELWLPRREVRNNLPAERDAFVGRTAELRALADGVDGGARLVTVLGAGGTGKTRLARRYALAWLGDWPGGAYFCDLSEARSLDGIHFAVGSALGVPLGRDDPGAKLGNAIAGRGRCLLLLDNFEQVAVHAAATVGRWLDAAPACTFIVTSRERLHLPGEQAFPLEPLPVAADAIDLFAARARAQRTDFVLTDGNRGAVTEVVRLLDGLPLAIELAAARIRVLSPKQLVERLRDRFTVLAGARGATARQATLRAAIDWSYELLAPWEQDAFAQCATFEGGFTLEAAEAVLDLSRWPQAPPVMDVVQALVDKSLLHVWTPAEHRRYDIDEPYFGLYLSIRAYAEEKLLAMGPQPFGSAQLRHGRYFARFGRDDALAALKRHDGNARRLRLALELDNLVAACRRAVARADGDTAAATFLATWAILVLSGPYAPAVDLGAQVMALGELDDARRAAAAESYAWALRCSGRLPEARERLAEALACARACGDLTREGRVRSKLGDLSREQGRIAEANEHLEAALALAARAGDRLAEGRVHNSLGLHARAAGRLDEARSHLLAALAIARDAGMRDEEGVAHNSLATVAGEAGNFDETRAHLEAALRIARETGYVTFEAAVEANLGQLHLEQYDAGPARAHLDAALRITREVGDRRLEAVAVGNLACTCMLDGRPQEAEGLFERALAIVRAIGVREGEGHLLGSLAMLYQEQGRVEEARTFGEAALALAREVHDRRTEATALRVLGQLHFDQGRISQARETFDLALALARDIDFRLLEGELLGRIGALLEREGRASDALAALRAGEAVLRQTPGRDELCKLLCARGRVEAMLGDRDGARITLAEAEAMAITVPLGLGAEAARELESLRRLFLAGGPTTGP